MGTSLDFYDFKNPKLRRKQEEVFDISSGHDHDGVNSKAVTVGTVADLAVTNAKLAADVKVGSLAALTTTETASVVGAINELDTDIGAPASLTTTVKTSAVLAINELDADIGNLATLTTSAKTSAVAAINELQTEVSACATKTGVETLTNKTLTSPALTTPLIDDGDAGLTITSSDQTHGSAIATVPDIGDAADEFVMKDTVQILTNKRLTSPKINEDVVLTATATQLNEAGSKASSASRLYNLGTPILADDNRIVTTTDMKVGTYTIAASPDVPRNLTVTVTDADASDTMGTLTVAGTNYADAVISEVITPVANSSTAGIKAFKTVTSITGADWVTAGGADQIIIGVGDELGLPLALDATSEMIFGILGTTITAHNPTIAAGTASIEETTIDMSAGTYDGSKAALVFVVD